MTGTGLSRCLDVCPQVLWEQRMKSLWLLKNCVLRNCKLTESQPNQNTHFIHYQKSFFIFFLVKKIHTANISWIWQVWLFALFTLMLQDKSHCLYLCRPYNFVYLNTNFFFSKHTLWRTFGNCNTNKRFLCFTKCFYCFASKPSVTGKAAILSGVVVKGHSTEASRAWHTDCTQLVEEERNGLVTASQHYLCLHLPGWDSSGFCL